MAIASIANWTANIGIPEVFEKGFTSVVYNNPFVKMWPLVPAPVGDNYLFKAHLAANSSVEVFTESAAQPTPVAQTYANGTLAYIYFRAMTRITGHLRDALQGMSASDGFNVIDLEFQLAAEQVADLAGTTFLGSANNGIGVAVDSSTTYAGLNRSTYSGWQSYETAVSTTLAFAHIDDMREALKDNNRGGNMDIILCPWNQVSNIQRLIGLPAATSNSYRTDMTASGGNLQLAALYSGTRWGEALVVGMGDMADTEIYGLSTAGIKVVSRRGLDIRQDSSGDDDVYQISMAMTLVVPRPHQCGKLTGVTA